ncbi:MAG: T9SS C-terminal target domain-containing protein, partial [Flavobacterium sp.]|nr:T9SS C-terminal target domain-containing protein [Flavobacterium sp.]
MKKLYFSLLTFLFLVVAHAQIVNIPNAYFKAKLLAADINVNIASIEAPNSSMGNVSSYCKIDTNNDNQIQVSEANAIKYLNIPSAQISNLQGISGFSNLEYLNCFNNQLSVLNIDLLTNLKYLKCKQNQLNNFTIGNLTNLKYINCAYNQLTNINLSGLINLTTLYCENNELQGLELSNVSNLSSLNCGGNQITSLNLNGLPNMSYLECSFNLLQTLIFDDNANLSHLNCNSNSLSTLNISSFTNLSFLACGLNQISSLDVSGLINLYQFGCGQNQIQTLDVSNSPNLVELICNNNQLSKIFMKNNSNLAWNTLTFSGNPNLKYICADENDLTFVQQKVNSLGYSNCQVNSYCNFVPGGVFYTIQGNNNLDANNNGCDASDLVYPNLKFYITDGTISGSLISNNLGNYSIPVSAGTHTITATLENPSYFTVSPTNAVVSFPTEASPFIQNFCIAPNGIHHDLVVVVIPLIPARPGFDAKYKIKYKNKGNLNETATVNFNYNEAILD